MRIYITKAYILVILSPFTSGFLKVWFISLDHKSERGRVNLLAYEATNLQCQFDNASYWLQLFKKLFHKVSWIWYELQSFLSRKYLLFMSKWLLFFQYFSKSITFLLKIQFIFFRNLSSGMIHYVLIARATIHCRTGGKTSNLTLYQLHID